MKNKRLASNRYILVFKSLIELTPLYSWKMFNRLDYQIISNCSMNNKINNKKNPPAKGKC